MAIMNTLLIPFMDNPYSAHRLYGLCIFYIPMLKSPNSSVSPGIFAYIPKSKKAK